jgi:hypothetical protein
VRNIVGNVLAVDHSANDVDQERFAESEEEQACE